MIKNCKNCGKEFQTKTKSYYCCQECRAVKNKEYHRQHHRKWQKENADHYNEYMRQYYLDDENYQKHCARCRAGYQAREKNAKASKCQHPRCNQTDNLQLHHISYDGLGAMATITLCQHHHKQLHAQENRQKKAAAPKQIKCTVSCKVVQQ